MGKVHQLADLQLAIMQVLWSKGPSTVGEVRDALRPERTLAHTTVGTMLSKMELKGHVKHRCSGRRNLYRAVIREEKVSQSMVNDLVDRLFAGDISQMVCQLLGSDDVTLETIAYLKKVIRQREQELDRE